jgi:enamine deaminase RidA (YjgF/YER057c/UK114 family)
VTRERRHVSSGSPFEPVIGFSRAVRVGDRVLVSGTAPIRPDGTVEEDPADQMRRCLQIVETALAEVGASLGDVVRTRTYLVDAAPAGGGGPARAPPPAPPPTARSSAPSVRRRR